MTEPATEPTPDGGETPPEDAPAPDAGEDEPRRPAGSGSGHWWTLRAQEAPTHPAGIVLALLARLLRGPRDVMAAGRPDGWTPDRTSPRNGRTGQATGQPTGQATGQPGGHVTGQPGGQDTGQVAWLSAPWRAARRGATGHATGQDRGGRTGHATRHTPHARPSRSRTGQQDTTRHRRRPATGQDSGPATGPWWTRGQDT